MTARLSCVWRSLNGDPRRPDPAPRGVARAAGARRLGRAPVPTFARGRAGAPPSGSRARRAGGGRTGREPDDRSGIRLPRAILALAIGAILGLSGAALQGLLRNPLRRALA